MNGYNFTGHVRASLAHARDEAAQLHNEYIGTEHVLLGLLRVDGGALIVLEKLGVDLDVLRDDLIIRVKRGTNPSHGPDLPYTSRAKKVLELAMFEARDFNHSFVGTEHLLLGLLREEKGLGAQALLAAGVTLDRAREETLRIVGEGDRSVSEPVVPVGGTVSKRRMEFGPAFTVLRPIIADVRSRE